MTVSLHHDLPKPSTETDNRTCYPQDEDGKPAEDLPSPTTDNSSPEKNKMKRKVSFNNNDSDEEEMIMMEEMKMRRLLRIDEAPKYLTHNRFILSGYRGLLTTKLCLESVFWWTNETINIWSHIFGFVLFFGLTVYDISALKIHGTATDVFIVSKVLICFMVCMIMSALYHTFSCRSEEDFHSFLCYDLFGIALSLLSIYVSGIYFAFWCHPHWQIFYIITVTLIFVFAMTLHIPSLNIDSNVKMLVFVAWAAYGVVPTIHWTIEMGGIAHPVVELLLPRVIGMYLISGLAFFIYLAKIPERFFAGKFDYLGHSHQWWHIIIVLALYYWHSSGIVYVNYRLNHACTNSMRID